MRAAHPHESVLVGLVSVNLIFLPWALGGMKEWSQFISLALSGCALLFALLPRNYDDRSDGQPAFRLQTWPRLLRFPIFWLGLLLFVYITVGALNPSWVYATDGTSWWMVKVAANAWLPAGVQVPFEMWGPWRMLLIYASVWMLVCAVWTGFSRRHSIQAVLLALSGSAVLLACLGLAQRATAATKIFWLWEPPHGASFVASFIYKNHAGAYFCLLFTLTIGLAFWLYERGVRRLDKSSPAGLFTFFAAVIAAVVFFSYSRTAALLVALFVLFAFGVFVWQSLRRFGGGAGRPVMPVVFATLLLGLFILGAASLPRVVFAERMVDLRRVMTNERFNDRPVVALATWEMAKDHPYAGWGAGSFRFIFPIYQQRYPEIFTARGLRLYYDHGHNDYLELLAELGFAGMAILLAGAIYAGSRLIAFSFWSQALPLCVVSGCSMTLLHSIIDFNFYNPAVQTTWFVLLFSLIRWLELGDRAIRGQRSPSAP